MRLHVPYAPSWSPSGSRTPSGYTAGVGIDYYTEYTSSILEWWRDGKLHREPPLDPDGKPVSDEAYPAIAYEDGTLAWYHDGKLHRDGGPAIVYANGTAEWWRDGECVGRMTVL
jgi:hypothetical protein